MYSPERHFCQRTTHLHTTHCGNTGQLGSLKVYFLKESFPAVSPAHLGAHRVCVQGQLPLPETSTSSFRAGSRKGRALTPSLGDFVFHWPLPFNHTRAAHHKKLILSLTKKSQPIWRESNRKCEIRGLFCGILIVNFDHPRWHGYFPL